MLNSYVKIFFIYKNKYDVIYTHILKNKNIIKKSIFRLKKKLDLFKFHKKNNTTFF